MGEAVYATREDVKRGLDITDGARANLLIDQQLAAGARAVDRLCHRIFYPWTGTRYFDWPDDQLGRSYRLWLDSPNYRDLISATSVTSGGVVIPSTEYFLRPYSGPPYTYLELDLDSSASFGQGSTRQRDVGITGLWGYGNDEAPAGALAAPLDSSSATVDVDSPVGVGAVLRVDSERMLVTGTSMLSTGQTLQADLDESMSDTLVAVVDGTAFAVEDVILLDAERMLVEDVAGNNLIVRRGWDGSVLAAHTGSTVFAARRLTVERGALGTTAAAHSNGATLARWVPPALVHDLNVAEAMNGVEQQRAAYARIAGSGENAREARAGGLKDLRQRVYEAHARRVRLGVV
ncbi:hypothetical protein [Prauserella muralis]|uniref:Uncharacterized protein n=1 Tax=Prauserella muralis TaxID=588067 RepID=A0A2V4AZX9_9PSEU|nr:hypothetical protein [Prauserella muralis]PXY27432.1 hypothetical protein BAY60_13435 [Prauserella muralis]TWE22868.1 hypothetical protein FHX69_4124 [Prauserella muralis]